MSEYDYSARNDVLETDEIYLEPKRSYPKKTFDDGSEVPDSVLHELSEMPSHIDYSVFSKNQLRFTEKLLKTTPYLKYETYIRGPSFFINLDKPKYWNNENYKILVNNIKMACTMAKEILESIPNKYNTTVSQKAASIAEKMANFFDFNYLDGKNFIEQIWNLYDTDTILATLGIDKTFTDIFAVGLFCATYNKVISIITYLNPYVQIKKDAGVNTMTPPKNTADNIKGRERMTVNYRNLLLESTETDENADVKEKVGRTLNGKVSITVDGDSYGRKRTNNPFIRIYAQPLYSLNILLPIKIAPTFFITLNNYSSLAESLKAAKLPCSILKISITSALSKSIFININNEKITLNVIGKKLGDKIVTRVTGRIGYDIGLEYYRKLMAVRSFHYFEGTQTGGNSVNISKLNAAILSTEEELNALNQAKNYLYQTINNEPVLDTGKIHFANANYKINKINKIEKSVAPVVPVVPVELENTEEENKMYVENEKIPMLRFALQKAGIKTAKIGGQNKYLVKYKNARNATYQTLSQIKLHSDEEIIFYNPNDTSKKLVYRPDRFRIE